MKRVVMGSMLVLSLFLGSLGPAGANRKTVEDSKTDATPNSVDLVRAKVGHSKNGRLRHVVTVHGRLSNADANAQLLLQFNLDGDRDCELEFIWPPAGRSEIIECSVGPQEATGKISKIAPRKLKFVFRKSVLGSPDRYGWRIMTRDCPDDCEVIDTLPDENGENEVYVRHNLN